MPKRGANGRFIKSDEEGLKISFSLPSLSRIILWGLFLLILSPWIFIIIRFEIWKKIISKFETLLLIKEEGNGPAKKNGLF